MRTIAVAALLLTLPAGTVRSQWWVGVEVGSPHYRGSSRDTSTGGGPRLRPGDGTTVAFRVDRRFGRVGVAVRASFGKPGIVGDQGPVAVMDKSTGQVVEVATLVAVRVGGIGPSGAVRAEVGPALHLWNIDDDVRSRVSALGALAYEWPLAGRCSGAIRLEGTLSRSWFEEGELPPEYDLRLTWRYGVTLGLRYRL